MAQSEHQPGRLAILSDQECWDLLRTQSVGRIAWSGLQGISVIPVNFMLSDGAVLVRTTAYSMLGRDSADREVAFEVDSIDAERQVGWSVLVRGRCVREERMQERPEPWVTGPRNLGLRIEVRTISGRRILPAPGRPPTTGQSDEECFTA